MAELAAAYLPPLAVLLTAAVSILLALAFFVAPKRKLAWAPAFLGALLGLCWHLAFTALVCAPVQALAGQTVTVTAVVETDCVPSYQEGMLRGTLLLSEIDGAPAKVRVYCQSFPGTEPGARFTARLSLQELEQDAYRLGRCAKGTYLAAAYEGGRRALAESAAPRFALYRLRQALSARLRTYLPRTLAGIESAMLLGDKSRLTDAVQNDFRAAGVSHLLSVSGLHVALLCGLFAFGLRAGAFSRWGIARQAAVVVFYMLLTGLPVSVQRAGLVSLVALLGCALWQPPDALTSMGLAALALGLQNAYLPCDIGFQLSFCGVLGVQLAGALSNWEHARLLPPGTAETPGNRAKALLLQALDAAQSAALATLATLPVLVAQGLTTSGVAVLSNLLVVWMLRPALLLGLVVLALSLLPVLAPAMHMASLALAVWLNIMYALVGRCAALPLARLFLPRLYTLLVLGVLGALALIFWNKRRMRLYLPAAALCTVAAVLLGVWMQRDVVRVGVVGTAGNPCVLLAQNGQAVLLFRGGASNLAAAEEYLAAHGAPRLTAVVDLRQQPEELPFTAERLYLMSQMEKGLTQKTVLDGVTLDLYHASDGNLAVAGVGDYHLAAMAGNVALPMPVRVDLLCAAGAYPKALRADTILYTAAAPRWLGQVQGERLLFGAEGAAVILRPARSVQYEEVTPVAVQ